MGTSQKTDWSSLLRRTIDYLTLTRGMVKPSCKPGITSAQSHGWPAQHKESEYNHATVLALKQIRIQLASTVAHGTRTAVQNSHVPATVVPAPARHAQSTQGGSSAGGTGGGFQFGLLPHA